VKKMRAYENASWLRRATLWPFDRGVRLLAKLFPILLNCATLISAILVIVIGIVQMHDLDHPLGAFTPTRGLGLTER
jgi:hypothetical protein